MRPSPLALLASPFLALLLALVGCPKPEAPTEPAARPLEGVSLRLTVVDDPGLAGAITRLRGEWNSQTGASLDVEEATEAKLLDSKALSGDAVICASHLLGVLAERGMIEPLPQPLLQDREWAGIFELLKLREAAWARQTYAVPFGSPVLMCYYRADLLEKLGRKPPTTWPEYEDIAKLLAAEKPAGDGPWCGTIEPLAPGWAGLMLLARAAPYAKHRDNYSTLFNIDTMEPLVAVPPVVQALEELAAAVKLGPADPFRYDPAAARAAFWSGQCGMALTWPTAAMERRKEKGEGRGESAEHRAEPSANSTQRRAENGEGSGESAARRAENAEPGLVASATSKPPEQQLPRTSPELRVGFVELPGSRTVYNLSSQAWDRRSDEEERRVPLLSIAGRIGVMGAKSPRAEAAFQLLLWLSSSRMSPQVSPSSPATTLFRQTHLTSPGQWVEPPVSAAAAVQYAEAAQAALRHEQWLAALPLPGRAEYLAALDEAVGAVVHGEKAALNALMDADAKWRKITERLGLDRQKAAYRHSLGLE